MEPRGGAWQTSNVENLPPHTLRLLYKEVSTLTSDPPAGIKLFPNEEDVTDVQVTIEGPEGTPYAGGLFRMKLVLGKEFPAAPPKGFFLTKIFHPNVGPGGEICVNVLKRDWKAELGLRHVLLTIKCLLIHPNPESALNEEAGRLLLENYEEYAARARLLTEIHAQPPPHRLSAGGGGGASRAPPESSASTSAPPGASPPRPRAPWPRSTRATATRSWRPRRRRTRSGRCGGSRGGQIPPGGAKYPLGGLIPPNPPPRSIWELGGPLLRRPPPPR